MVEILGLARAVRHDRGVGRLVGHLDGVERLGERADLVDLDEDRVGDALLDAPAEPLGIGHEEVVADQLDLAAELVGGDLPAFPVVLGQAVLDRDDRVLADQLLEIGDLLGRLALLAALAGVDVGAVLEELAGGRVERDGDVVAGLVAGLVDRLHDEVERLGGGAEIGGEAALVADVGVVAGVGQRLLEGVEGLRPHAHGVGKGRRAEGDDHELLEIDRVVGMNATVEHVHHRHRQDAGIGAADIAVERQGVGLRRRLGGGQRHAQDGVGAEPALVGRAVERDHGLVDVDLALGLETADRFEDLAVDRFDGLLHALAAVAPLVAVAQLDRLVDAGRGAGGHRRAAERAVFQNYVDLDGGIAAAVKDFAADDIDDRGHKVFSEVIR